MKNLLLVVVLLFVLISCLHSEKVFASDPNGGLITSIDPNNPNGVSFVSVDDSETGKKGLLLIMLLILLSPVSD